MSIVMVCDETKCKLTKNPPKGSYKKGAEINELVCKIGNKRYPAATVFGPIGGAGKQTFHKYCVSTYGEGSTASVMPISRQ